MPWKPAISEAFKTFPDLLNADRGGFVFESNPGAYEKAAELDFVSLYQNIMLKKTSRLKRLFVIAVILIQITGFQG